MNERVMDIGRGMFLIDAGSFLEHQAGRDRCRRYDAGKPDTLALLCLDGSILLKNDCPKLVKPKPVLPSDKEKVSKKDARMAMRYKS